MHASSSGAGGDDVRNQELLAKIAALEEKAADYAKTKEATAKTIEERNETIKTLTADIAALTADNAALKEDNAALMEDNAELRTANMILLANNTTNAAANTAHKTANRCAVNLTRDFKKAYIREQHMRHKSDGRHGAALRQAGMKLLKKALKNASK
jgi:regulator of replication initiation timing